MTGKDRLDKVLAVAINPGAYEKEAVAALHKARKLVKREPKAYILRLKSQFICDFATPTTVRVKCDGRETACDAFKEQLDSLVKYIRSRRCEA